jgi:hypothetical protein
MKRLAEFGLTIDQIVEVATLLERPADAAAEKRRAYDRERKRKPSGGIPVEIPVEVELVAPVENPVEFHRKPAPLARATENNLTTTVIEPNLTSPNYDAPERATLDLLECQLTEAVGVALASKATAHKLFDLSPILGLLRSGDGPPCDLQADVLPTLRAAAARSSPGSIKTWAYFTGAIREARDRRLTGAPVIQINPQGQTHERAHAPSQKRATREGNHARAFQGALAAAVARQPG